MSYISLLNNFWQQNEIEEFNATECQLYLYLVNVCNNKKWPASFALSNKHLMLALNISESSLLRYRNNLVKRGLISCRKGKFDSRIPEYSISYVLEHTVSFTPTTDGKTEEKAGENRKQTEEKAEHIIDNKNIDNKTEESSRPATRKTRKGTPTFEDVCDYFARKGAAAGLADCRASARRFYDTFAAVGWRDKFNRRITCWQNRANQWITDDINKQNDANKNDFRPPQNSRTEQHLSDSRQQACSGIPIRGKYTPSCGLQRADPGREASLF